ncbi:FAM120B [Cordylochernes scorpioides]|uniref:FAM120B n=1 Tax=Cordylochernes scorpioides TaxID=51811 RepID=A0ABY6LLF0_9ARAC|nr:FAM120B [Cordylochernes scorpioides]
MSQLWHSHTTDSQRLACYLDCLGLGDRPDVLQSLPAHQAVLCSVLAYLVSRQCLAHWEVEVLLLQALCQLSTSLSHQVCPSHHFPNQLCGTVYSQLFFQQDKETANMAVDSAALMFQMAVMPRAVHLASLFLRGVLTLCMLSSAVGHPLPLAAHMPWHFFDGKLFHQLYCRRAGGTSLPQLLEELNVAGDIYANLQHLQDIIYVQLQPQQELIYNI